MNDKMIPNNNSKIINSLDTIVYNKLFNNNKLLCGYKTLGTSVKYSSIFPLSLPS